VTTSSGTSDRALHLVDLENLLGDPRADAVTALATFDVYLDVAGWQRDDHVIIATNPWLMTKIAFDLPVPTSRHAVHGRDGADTMLLALAPPELVVKRYGRLVIGSGDGIFVHRARTVRDHGVAVAVVARANGCSARLRPFACTYLQPATTDVVLAA
jgi:hypothetical protein